MAKVRVDLNCVPVDGQAVAFKAPCDCTAVDGILCYYAQGNEKVSKAFVFKDAHGNNVAGIGNLFAAGSVVKVVLDVTGGAAYLQNADTNAYLEGRFAAIGGDFAVEHLVDDAVVTGRNPGVNIYRNRIGKMVTLYITFNSEAASNVPVNTWTVVGTLKNYFPSIGATCIGINSGASDTDTSFKNLVYVSGSSGEIRVLRGSSTGYFNATLTYITH